MESGTREKSDFTKHSMVASSARVPTTAGRTQSSDVALCSIGTCVPATARPLAEQKPITRSSDAKVSAVEYGLVSAGQQHLSFWDEAVDAAERRRPAGTARRLVRSFTWSAWLCAAAAVERLPGLRRILGERG